MTPIQPPMTDERLDRLVRQLLTERADDVAAVAMPAETMTAVVASHVRRGGSPTAERCCSSRRDCSSCWRPAPWRSVPG